MTDHDDEPKRFDMVVRVVKGALPDGDDIIAQTIALLQEIRDDHRDPSSEIYNECEKAECYWCEQAAQSIAWLQAYEASRSC